MIGNTALDGALLDIRISINLLSYTMYQKLRLGKIQPTKVTLYLFDRSVKRSLYMVEHMLIKVSEFISPIDFIILRTELTTNHEV